MGGETGAARVGEEALGAGEVGFPVLGEVGEEMGGLRGEGVWEAEHDALA